MFKKSLVGLIVVAATQLTACSSSDSDDNPVVNTSPTNILLSNDSVAERAIGAEIGTLSAVDADTSDTFTFSTTNENFVISGATLSLAPTFSLDFEATTATDVDITVTDSAANTYTKTLTINVEDVLDIYAFTNNLSNDNSVSYSGQTARHVLIAELTNYIGSGLQADLDNQAFTNRQEVIDKLMSFYKISDEQYDLETVDRPLTIATTSTRKQNTLGEISSSTKDLSGKIAGNDATGQHQDWNTEFLAFGAKGDFTPETLIESFFAKIADFAELEMNGSTRTDFDGNLITKIYLGEDGLDYKQLVQKVLLGAVALSQGADDYLDDATEGKGLLTQNTTLVDGKAYTDLEHQFDEGFGYFGAARDYLSFSDAELSSKGGREAFQGMHDSNQDSYIDLKSEYNFGHSLNAAKRDLGTVDNTSPTDFTELAMQGFLQGRKIIADNVGAELTTEQMTELLTHRDAAVNNWEKAVAATAIHYINDVTADYATFDTADFNYADLAKHWSELKGFVVSLQFAPYSPLSDEQYASVNALIGDAPVLVEANVQAYLADLSAARLALQTAYSFDAENVANW